MTFENLLVEAQDGILTVTINRPKVLNALNGATLCELDKAFSDAGSNAEVGGVILTGAGDKAFVAGADINELARLGPLDARKTARGGQQLFTRIERLGKPVIAAINGFALGGGLEIALACSFRIASTNAAMGLPEVKLGVIPGYGGTQRLPRIVGMGRALELILTGEPIPADAALNMGLVNHVTEPDQLLPKARDLMNKIRARGPLAVQSALEAAYQGYDLPIDDGLNLEASLFSILASTEDMKEGLQAFLDKRSPQFRGN